MVTSASAPILRCFKVLGRRRRNHEKADGKRPSGWGEVANLPGSSWPSVNSPSFKLAKGISPRCMISARPLEGLRDYSFDQSVMLLSRIGAMSGRVKMSKFLLTVCAFGLLLSFAFA